MFEPDDAAGIRTAPSGVTLRPSAPRVKADFTCRAALYLHARRRRSTRRSSHRTRPAPCASSARPTRSAPATASCSPSTTTTRSTGSANSRARETLVGGEFGDAMTIDDYAEAIGLPSGGAVRASLGLASNFDDIHRFSVL